MRVSMVNKYYPPHLGGIEFHLRDLAEGLVTHAGAQVRAIVCNGENSRVEERVDGVDVVRLPRATEFSSTPLCWGFAREITAEAARVQAPDVFHFHFPYPWGELAWLAARPQVPLVITYHSDIVRQKAALVAYRPFLERFLDSADLIVASSPNMIEHSPYLAPRAQKCRHVNFGLHVERFAGDETTQARAQALRAEHGGRRVVLFVGRLIYYKGADVLVRAMQGVDADLVMIGRGPLEGELREIATAHGMSERVRFLDPVDEPELAAWYAAADVFALPSVARSEAFGLVQIEAHAAGTPVVSTNLTTGVPYANLHEVTGLIVPVGDADALADALRRLLADDELRERLGRQAKERALTDFTIPRMVENTTAVYREAMALHAQAAGRRS
ncbi:MAG: glycosyltransferase [Coriobacteriia bacterium]|nr:glycosyltransferase [Coriobacteriia bacterium]